MNADTLFDLWQYTLVEFNDSPTTETDKMVVVSLIQYDEASGRRTMVYRTDKAELCQQVQRPVDSHTADAGGVLVHEFHQLISANMPFA